jgi:hypothetical protein
MTQTELDEEFRKFRNRLETAYGRCRITYDFSVEVISESKYTLAFIEDEPEKIVGYFSTRHPGNLLKDQVVFDKPRALQDDLPLAVAAAMESIITGNPVGCCGRETHGNN